MAALAVLTVIVALASVTAPADALVVPHGPSSEFRAHTVLAPKFYHAREKREIPTTRNDNSNEHVHDLFVEININGEEQTLELTLNRDLLSGSFFLKHQENGGEKVHRPSQKEVELCQYQGSLRGVPTSWAAVSTCNGLRGVLFDGHELHYLEPANFNGHNLKGTHSVYLYKHADSNLTQHSCGAGQTPLLFQGTQDDALDRSRRSPESGGDATVTNVHGPQGANIDTRYLELVLVVDHKSYVELGSNKDKVYQRCKDVANIVNALYTPLNISIALVGVVVWTEFDETNLVPNGDTTLANFLHYRKTRLSREHPNDNAQLITRVKLENHVAGKALKGPICTFEFSGGLSVDSDVVGLLATRVAHQIGHNLGMEHDSNECHCPGESCIMSSQAASGLSPTSWSNCSEASLQSAFRHGMDYCLRNKPSRLFGSPVCGNGFVEAGEQCDCGLEGHCNSQCCDPATCTLRANATCATGECCDMQACRLKAAGSLCRSADKECDLPEVCTGTSEYCPEDAFKRDGQPCSDRKAFCYHGMCRTKDDQCKLLWGPTGKKSHAACYTLNTKGSRHGNCGYHRLNQTYVKCAQDDIFCGMLQCEHSNDRLEFGMEATSIVSHSFLSLNGTITPCRTVIVDLGLSDVDPGLVPDGAKCGEGKMCVNQKCVAVDSLTGT